MNRNEVKLHNQDNQRFHYNNSEEVIQCSDHFQRFHFSSSELKQGSDRSQRFVLIVLK